MGALFAWVAGLFTVAGVVNSTITARNNAAQQEELSRYNAEIARQDAETARLDAEADEVALRRRQFLKRGTQRANAGASGAKSSTFESIFNETSYQHELDALTVRVNGKRRSQDLEQKGVLGDYRAKNYSRKKRTASRTGFLNLGTAVLGLGKKN
jgi:hypothetical protein